MLWINSGDSKYLLPIQSFSKLFLLLFLKTIYFAFLLLIKFKSGRWHHEQSHWQAERYSGELCQQLDLRDDTGAFAQGSDTLCHWAGSVHQNQRWQTNWASEEKPSRHEESVIEKEAYCGALWAGDSLKEEVKDLAQVVSVCEISDPIAESASD